MVNTLLVILYIFFIEKSQAVGLTNEKRKKLLKKVSKLVSFRMIAPLNSYNYRDYNITYEPSKIKEIIEKNDFPENFNFIETYNVTPNVKNQGGCGSRWSFASTTALAYRYKAKGIDMDLSPQYPLSCYLKDCEKGDRLIDTQFNLVKNGTVSESCLPYSSADGKTIEKCPSQCKNKEEEMKKYYSKMHIVLYWIIAKKIIMILSLL